MRKSMRYLIWGYYGHGNLGDELMLETIVRRIRECDPGALIHVRCLDVPRVKGIIPFQIERAGMNIPLLKQLVYIGRALFRLGKTDEFIIGGGTLFLDKGRHNRSMMLLAVIVVCAKIMRRRVRIIGAGIDRLEYARNESYLRVILRNCSSVALRDAYSYEYARRLLPSASILLSSDILFGRSFRAEAVRDPEKPRGADIVISLTDYYATWGTKDEESRFFANAVAFVQSVRDNAKGCSVVLAAFQRGIGEKDYELLSRIESSLSEESRDGASRVTVRHVADINDVRDIFSNARVVIGMRYHALVFGALYGCPFVGIDMEMKIRQLTSDFNMPRIDISELGRSAILIGPGWWMGRTIDDRVLDECASRSETNFTWLADMEGR